MPKLSCKLLECIVFLWLSFLNVVSRECKNVCARAGSIYLYALAQYLGLLRIILRQMHDVFAFVHPQCAFASRSQLGWVCYTVTPKVSSPMCIQMQCFQCFSLCKQLCFNMLLVLQAQLRRFSSVKTRDQAYCLEGGAWATWGVYVIRICTSTRKGIFGPDIFMYTQGCINTNRSSQYL